MKLMYEYLILIIYYSAIEIKADYGEKNEHVIGKTESSETNEDLIVEISNGKLKGKSHDYYHSYESIPYAEPPVGELRFEAPQQYQQKWTEIFDATVKPKICLQWNQFQKGDNKLIGTEDCLIVNVYKPKTEKEIYPVIIYIHGGAFMFGSVNEHSGELLMKSGKVILVTLTYRVGALGFMSTEDEAITGNFGLKDQQLALKWIKENIKHFGGDPNSMLLIGFSAGSASTHLQLLQPSLKDIVKAVVSFSGVALNPWVITKSPHKNTLKIAEILQCPDLTNTQEIKKCLKGKKALDIVASVKEFLNFGFNPFIIFGPVVEHKNVANSFMTEHPTDIIKSGNFSHLPWLASYVAQDGCYNAAELLQINPKTGNQLIDDLNDRWLELAPQNLLLQNIKDDPIEYAKKLKEQYLGDLKISEENYLKVQELYTDVLFRNGILDALKLHSLHSKAPVYGYVYDNPVENNLGDLFTNRTDIKFGTCHSDDFTLILRHKLSLKLDDQSVSQKFIKMLENFINTGELTFGDCKFENNAGNNDNLKLLLITKDKCETIILKQH